MVLISLPEEIHPLRVKFELGRSHIKKDNCAV